MIRYLWLLAWVPAQAGAFELAFPVQCVLNETCFIQQYVDHDAGPEATDFTCGPLSYDGHDGTDIAVPTVADMAEGVAVLAAAPGTVLGTRDGMRDGMPDASVKDRECGNGVLIDHGDGWQTQYCHMRQGSVAVQKGEVVATGTPLGLIGQSGQAEFPHLHLSVRKDGDELDPFAPTAAACGATGEDLWADPPPYTPGGILEIGMSTEVPEFEAIKAGLSAPILTPQSPALVVWAHVFGGRAGDAVEFTLNGPQGVVVAETVALERTQARLFRALGRRQPQGGWPPGAYEAEVLLLRDGVEIGRQRTTATLGN